VPLQAIAEIMEKMGRETKTLTPGDEVPSSVDREDAQHWQGIDAVLLLGFQ
jgi:hypothetical protein